MNHFADRLAAACRAKGNAVCVGLDPRWDQLPAEIRALAGSASAPATACATAYGAFCQRVLDLVAPLVPVVKPQMALFEAAGPGGLAALQMVLQRARELDLLVILDGKRNDIASTAQAYADAVFAGTDLAGDPYVAWPADALTVNPYLGRDAVEPFLTSARQVQGGLFVLVRTSNKGAGLFQDLQCDGRPVFEHVGAAVGAWTRENLGACGLGDVGAVVGATHPEEMKRLRALLPETIFLVPGYGAQGGSAADCAGAFRPDGLGAVVNSSRGIIASFDPAAEDWEEKIVAAARRTIADLAAATPMGRLQENGDLPSA